MPDYEFSTDLLTAALKLQLAKNLEKCAIHLKNKIKEKINGDQTRTRTKGAKGVWYKGDDPSKPGDPPKKVRGDLLRSIAYELNEDKTTAFVGTGLDYGLYLEIGTHKMAARPYLRQTLIEEADEIARIMSEPLSH